MDCSAGLLASRQSRTALDTAPTGEGANTPQRGPAGRNERLGRKPSCGWAFKRQVLLPGMPR